MTDQTWASFEQKVRQLLEPTASSKGYSTTGLDGKNALYEFVQNVAQGPGHALGEIVYKATRYGAKRNPEDLEKIAAWAFLAWRHHDADTMPASRQNAEPIHGTEALEPVPHGDGFGVTLPRSAKFGNHP